MVLDPLGHPAGPPVPRPDDDGINDSRHLNCGGNGLHPGPVGHAESQMPAGPYISPTAPQHTMPYPGNVAQFRFVIGVLATHGARLLHDKFDERKREDEHGGY